jgi:hypothetical protein
MKIILISGKANAGKDLTGLIMKDYLVGQNYKVLIIHYADLVKYICKQFFNWDGIKDEKGRGLLQYVGTEKVRSKYPDFWVDFVMNMLILFKGEWDYVIIPDARFPNEIDKLRNMGWDCTVLRVERNNFKSKLTEEQLQHPSETALDNYKFDYIIDNNGTIEELKTEIAKVKDKILYKGKD